jgi:formate hydrogenlyase transcriptional activator
MASLESKPDAELDKQFRFERLLAEISTFFINLPSDRIDSEIEAAQRRVCEFLDLDRSALFQADEEDPGTLLMTHFYQPAGSRIPPERMSLKEFFPWASPKILGGETITISKMTDLPAEAARDRETFGLYGTRSVVVAPLAVGRRGVFGLLTFAVMRQEREWTQTVVQQIQLVAQIFANALARRQAEETLRESEARLSVATDAAEAGLWILEPDSGYVWVTPKTRKLFHFTPDEELNYESFFKVIHPDDNEQVKQAVQQTIQSGEDLRSEFRIVLPDGGMRWIVARGKPDFRSAGKPGRLMGVSIDITERKQAEEALRERLQFEHLLSGLSARFVNIPPDQVDAEIEHGLRRILEFFQVDRGGLMRSLPDGSGHQITHGVYGENVPPVPLGVQLPRSTYPWVFEKLVKRHEVVSFARLDDLPPEANVDKQTYAEWGIRSALDIPIVTGGSVVHVIAINSVKRERVWPEELFPRLQLLGEIFVNAIERRQIRLELANHLREIEQLKERLNRENLYLREEIKLLDEHSEIIGQNAGLQRVLDKAGQVAQTDSTVLILGETGTGKELLARAIHRMSARNARPLVTVNCASLPPALIESELFGREKGAYTGALTQMIGRFEIADQSTLFLDEIGEIPLELQSKLLRVLESGRFERLGSTKTLQVNVRIIAATNRDLAQAVQADGFRKDLFYRLNVFPIVMPPLREHPDDIPLMVWSFVKEFQKKMGRRIEHIPKDTMQKLQSHGWPGNVRELRNVIERAMIMSTGETLVVDPAEFSSSQTHVAGELENMERSYITAVLAKAGWRVGGKGGAAEILGLNRTTLYSKIKKLGIHRPNP